MTGLKSIKNGDFADCESFCRKALLDKNALLLSVPEIKIAPCDMMNSCHFPKGGIDNLGIVGEDSILGNIFFKRGEVWSRIVAHGSQLAEVHRAAVAAGYLEPILQRVRRLDERFIGGTWNSPTVR